MTTAPSVAIATVAALLVGGVSAWVRRHRIEAARLTLSLRALPVLGEGQKPELLSSEARGGRGLGAMTVGRSLLLFGFVCLMVFTHVAEGLHLFSGMGWGLPDSPGHYLDFVSAVLGWRF